MKRFFKASILAASIAVGLGAAGSASAITGIRFDPTGAGGFGTLIDQITWTNNYVMSYQTFGPGAESNGGGEQGFLLGFGSFSSAQFNNVVAPGIAARFSYEFRIPVEMTTSLDGTTIRWKTEAYDAGNFFKMYYDPTPSYNTLLGTGFGTTGEVNADQLLILTGKVTLDVNSVGTAVSNYRADDLVSVVDLGTQAAGNTPNIVSVVGAGSVRMGIDVCSADELLSNPTVCTAVSTVDTNFFRSDVDKLAVDMTLGQGIQTPIPPEAAVGGGGLGNVPSAFQGIAPYYGGTVAGVRTNDYDCDGTPRANGTCDMIYAGQAAITRFQNTVVPEPGSLALLGLGLGALGVYRRRRQQLG